MGENTNSVEMWQLSSVATDRRFHEIKGKPLYHNRFDEVLSFHSPGLAPATLDGKWFHIRQDGTRAYSHSFDRAWGFYGGLASVIKGREAFHILENGLPAYDERFSWCGNFQEGLCSVMYFNGRYGHIKHDGSPAYKETYRYAGDFKDHSAVVQLDNGMHIHINMSGQPLNGHLFNDLLPFHKGLAPAEDEGGWFHIYPDGRPAYKGRFSFVEPFYNGQARVGSKRGGLLLIDEGGKVISHLMEDITSPLESLSNKMVGFWATQVIYAATELHVFDFLPGSIEEVSEGTHLSNDSTFRLLRGLWELALVRQDGDTWNATEEGKLLRADSKFDMASASWNWASLHYGPWEQLLQSLKTGKTGFELTHGDEFFTYLEKNEQDARLYQKAMEAYSRHDYPSLLESVDNGGLDEIVDVGGGMGAFLFSLMERNPNIRGTIFESPAVVQNLNVPDKIRSRLSIVSGDFFKSWPFRSGHILMSRVIHDWSDDLALKILHNAKLALLPGGKIYLIEMILSEDSPNGGLLDLNMLTMTGGRERTLAQFQKLLERSSLKIRKATRNKRFGYTIEVIHSETD